jgi:hypothetical protein
MHEVKRYLLRESLRHAEDSVASRSKSIRTSGVSEVWTATKTVRESGLTRVARQGLGFDDRDHLLSAACLCLLEDVAGPL